jgi:hypothetical protein
MKIRSCSKVGAPNINLHYCSHSPTMAACSYEIFDGCLFVLSRTINFSAIWRLSPLPVTVLQISTYTCYMYYGFKQWGFFYVSHLLRYRNSVFKVISERSVILTSECRALSDGAITAYFKHLRFDVTGPSRAQTRNVLIAKREHCH